MIGENSCSSVGQVRDPGQHPRFVVADDQARTARERREEAHPARRALVREAFQPDHVVRPGRVVGERPVDAEDVLLAAPVARGADEERQVVEHEHVRPFLRCQRLGQNRGIDLDPVLDHAAVVADPMAVR